MKLIWGIIKNEFKPRLFDTEDLPKEDVGKDLLSLMGSREVIVKAISSPFEMEEAKVSSVMNFYGISEMPKIIGSMVCEVTYYNEADIQG